MVYYRRITLTTMLKFRIYCRGITLVRNIMDGGEGVVTRPRTACKGVNVKSELDNTLLSQTNQMKEI